MILPDCFSGYGHDWYEVTTFAENAKYQRHWICVRCDVYVTVDEGERVRRGQRSGYGKVPA